MSVRGPVGGVREREHIVERPERMAGWERLGLEDIERRAPDAAIAQRIDECGFVDDAPRLTLISTALVRIFAIFARRSSNRASHA